MRNWATPIVEGDRRIGHRGSVRDALRVDDVEGPRWDLAVDLLHEGSGVVSIGPLLLLRARTAGELGPVTIEILTSSGLVDRAPSWLDVLNAVASDERVASLIEGYGVDAAFVDDYGMGRATVGRVRLTYGRTHAGAPLRFRINQ